MESFDKVFADDIVDETEFDTVFGAEEDGELIDTVGQEYLFTESGDPREFDEEEYEDDDEEEEDDHNDHEHHHGEDHHCHHGHHGHHHHDHEDDDEEEDEEDDYEDESCGVKKECGPQTTHELDDLMNSDSVVAAPGEPECTDPNCKDPECPTHGHSVTVTTTRDLDNMIPLSEEDPDDDEEPVGDEEVDETCKKCVKEGDCCEMRTDELDRLMMADGEDTPQDIRDKETEDPFDDIDSTDADVSVTEAVKKFSILPEFKKEKSLHDFKPLASDLDKLLAKNGEEVTNADIKKAGMLLLRIFDVLDNICKVFNYITLPSIIFAPSAIPVRMINMTINLLLTWAERYGQMVIAENYFKDGIKKCEKIKKSAKDAKTKAECDKMINKLKEKIDRLNAKNESAPLTTRDLDAMFESGEPFDSEENVVNSDDIEPDSEGALDDGDDIDSIEEALMFI